VIVLAFAGDSTMTTFMQWSLVLPKVLSFPARAKARIYSKKSNGTRSQEPELGRN
jgi:hypothetical protein